MIITRVAPVSAAKIAAAIYAVIGLFAGAVMTLAMGGAFASDGPGPDSIFSIFFGAGAIIALPIFYGVLGFVGTLIMAALYNVLASAIGGVEVDISQ